MKTKTLKITAEIKKLFNDGGKVKAALSLVIGGVIVIRGVRLVDGNKGMFVSMPSRRNADGEYSDVCFPINNETRLQILDTVTAAYEKAVSEQDCGDADSGEQETA